MSILSQLSTYVRQLTYHNNQNYMTGTGSIGHGGPYFFFLLLFFFNIYLFIIIFYRPWLGLHAEILGPHLSKLIKLIPGSFQSDPEIIELGLF